MNTQPGSFLGPSLFALAFASALLAEDPAAYEPELFERTELVYEESIGGELDPEHGEVRQGCAGRIEDGVLVGSESAKEFQEKRKCLIDDVRIWRAE